MPTSRKTTVKPVSKNNEILNRKFQLSELVIGLVGPVGTELEKVKDILENRLKLFSYESSEVSISRDVIPYITDISKIDKTTEFSRISGFMSAGNKARQECNENAVLALGAAAKINTGRSKEKGDELPFKPRHAYIINSLKHPEEVDRLREIYTRGFFLIGVAADQDRRAKVLCENKRLTPEQAEQLMIRDEDENLKYGQLTTDTFHLSDFFIHLDKDNDRLERSVWRILDLIFGHPNVTPTFDEFAMFMAFSASLRSADLSRQVGAVIARDEAIIATGANDCPRSGGGLYWPLVDSVSGEITDYPDGRDYMRGYDSNKSELENIISNIIQQLKNANVKNSEAQLHEAISKSKIKDITEYGRVVHAEMEAILSCARSNISSQGATLYCTTFPCHNCAKHLIAAGISRVVYVEPYAKSKASEFHKDAIVIGLSPKKKTDKVRFDSFVGVGSRRFLDLFSMNLGSGFVMKRKDAEGKKTDFDPGASKLRTQLLPWSYLERETLATSMFNSFKMEETK